jgi:hypothetical protein
MVREALLGGLWGDGHIDIDPAMQYKDHGKEDACRVSDVTEKQVKAQ